MSSCVDSVFMIELEHNWSGVCLQRYPGNWSTMSRVVFAGP